MVKKTQEASDSSKTSSTNISSLSAAIKDSAQQIWLAGLGAFSKAQAEGSKAFDTLVKEGTTIQRKTQAVAEERFSEASHRVSDIASDITSKATGKWDKLENVFEDRVSKALKKLGVPSSRDVESLSQRIDALSLQVKATKFPGAAKTAARKAVAARSPAKKAAPRKTAVRKATTTRKPAARTATEG